MYDKKTGSMKQLVLFVLVLGNSLIGWCQFTGGAGDGFSSTELAVTVSGIGTAHGSVGIALAPNPSLVGQATIVASKTAIERIRVFDARGVEIATSQQAGMELPPYLTPGMYVVLVTLADGRNERLRWIVQG